MEFHFAYFFAPLCVSIRKEVILLVVSNGRGGISEGDLRLKASLMYV